MKLSLEKSSDRGICRYDECQNNPKYINDLGRIKKDTTCVRIHINGITAFYCRECIDKIYEDMRKVLNSKLWIFN